MERYFNTEGPCFPGMHYMVPLAHKIEQIFGLIKERKYFTIHRPRQYGKTTVLYSLLEFLDSQTDYLPIQISFEGMGRREFEDETYFIQSLLMKLEHSFLVSPQPELLELLQQNQNLTTMTQLGIFFTKFVLKAGKKVVFMIDEVDQSSNYGLFLAFLGLLRSKYIARNAKRDFTFHSVILVGVHDIKNLKEKIRPEEGRKYDSPWDIAAEFSVSLNFDQQEITAMLQIYSLEKGVSMDAQEIGEQIFRYTSGYPFLVSKLCQIIDEKLLDQQEPLWNSAILERAVHLLLQQKNLNFETLIKNLENDAPLTQLVESIVLEGKEIEFDFYQPQINHGILYGIFQVQEGVLQIHNRIYDQLIYNYLSLKLKIQELLDRKIENYSFQDQFYQDNGSLNLKFILQKFQEFMREEYSKKDEKLIERNGRLIFFAFLKPILNGKGFDFKEVTISEEKRLDVVITYLNQKYVVELKLWRGEIAHQKGIQQLQDYLNRLHLQEGYLLIFDITKTGKKAGGQKHLSENGKEIFMIWV